MKKIVPLLLCLLFGFSQYSWPQSGGGFPSNPKFQTVTVSSGSSSHFCGGLQPGALCATSTTALSYAEVVTALDSGLDVAAGNIAADNVFRVTNNAQTSLFFNIGGTGAVTFPNATSFTVAGQAVCQANGTNCPSGAIKTAFANTLTSNTACPLSTTPQSSGISGCARNSVGSYTFTFTAGFTTNAPVCMASFQAAAAAAPGFPTNPPALELGTSTTTNVTVLVATYTAIGTATLLDGLPISILCHGT
jgi:hypothetical protein